MPSLVSRVVSNRPRLSAASFVCWGRSSGWASVSSSLNACNTGGCCLTSSCTGKSTAFSEPAKAPSLGSSSSSPITSMTASFTPSRRTGPSSSRWDSMKNKGSGGGGLGSAAGSSPPSNSWDWDRPGGQRRARSLKSFGFGNVSFTILNSCALRF